MDQSQLNWLTNFIWGIADDVLRDLKRDASRSNPRPLALSFNHTAARLRNVA